LARTVVSTSANTYYDYLFNKETNTLNSPMVEGPGATRNGYKAKRLIQRRIENVQCNCNEKVGSLHDEVSNLPWWTDRYLSEVISIGKELFLVFARLDESSSNLLSNDDVAIRLHFGMNGTLQIISTFTAARSKSYRGLPTLCLAFGDSISSTSSKCDGGINLVETYQTTVSGPLSANIPRLKFGNLSSLDVCGFQFKPQSVLEKMKNNRNRERSISDILLDQHIYPGVGNIIKIEGLHAARLHPKQLLYSLSDNELHLVIFECRSYAMKWLNDGKAPRKAVYNQTSCGTCGEAKISLQRVGGSDRTTFWCINCQPFKEKKITNIEHRQEDRHTSSNRMVKSNIGDTTGAPQQFVMSKIDTFRRVCPTHGNTLILRRVRNGTNSSRIFHTCSMKNCKFFSWADTFFPLCRCQKRTILLMSKTERTGGKWFFSCAKKKQSGKCGYFGWAGKKDLERLGDMLTPLL
jgi:formamidopyrimidine-DNA glycosylase